VETKRDFNLSSDKQRNIKSIAQPGDRDLHSSFLISRRKIKKSNLTNNQSNQANKKLSKRDKKIIPSILPAKRGNLIIGR